jgi:hypothetical protein
MSKGNSIKGKLIALAVAHSNALYCVRVDLPEPGRPRILYICKLVHRR